MELKFKSVVGFRSEDAKFPAANLLRGGKWTSERKARSSVNDITLHMNRGVVINAIDIGNWGSSFISVEVSRLGLQRYQTLLPSTEIMSARDAQTKKNWTSVHMFSDEHFATGVREQKWDLVRITCMQPFLQDEQFGLSFFKAFSIPEKEPLAPQPQPQSPPPGSAFAMMRNRAFAKVSPLITNRSEQLLLAAKEKHNMPTRSTPAVKLNDATGPSCSHNRDSSSAHHTDPPHKANADHRISPFRSNTQDRCRRLYVSHKTKSSTTEKPRRPQIAQNVPSQSDDTPLSRARCSSSSPANVQKCTPSRGTATKYPTTSVNKKRRIVPPLSSDSENSFTDATPVQKVARLKQLKSSEQLKQLQTQVQSSHSDCRESLAVNTIEILSDSDSDASTVVLPLESLSPSQEQTDIDSDAETVILPLDVDKDATPHTAEVVATIEIPSSPESARSEVLTTNRDAMPGPSKIACPLCFDLFDASSIEQHAATCDLMPEPTESVCPICSRYFPLELLPRHADLCAEKTQV